MTQHLTRHRNRFGVPPFLTSIDTRHTAWVQASMFNTALSFGSAAWISANRALSMPFTLPFPYPIRRVFWVNGTTLSGNADLGIYSDSGALIYSTGSTAMSGVSAPQYVAKDLYLPPGHYYMSLACDNTTTTVQRTNTISVNALRLGGFLQQASAFALPSAMSPAAVTSAYWPVFGFTLTTTGF